MATTDQNITELPIKTASEVSDADYLMGIDLVEGYQVLTKDFADYVVNEAEITVGGKKQTTANAISEIGTTASNAQPKESGKGLSTNDYTTAEKNKLSGIASGAEVNVNADWTASSGDAQILHKPTTIAGYGITDAYTKTQVDGFVSEIDDVIKTDEIVSEDSNPITFETESAQIAKSTKITFEPIQDLHGYDHPWPAGGGKNLLNCTANTTEINGITYTINKNAQNEVVSIKANGTATGASYIDLTGAFTLKAGTYKFYIFSDLTQGTWYADIPNSSHKVNTEGGSITYSSDSDSVHVWFNIVSGTQVTNKYIYPMLVTSDVTPTKYEPYSNICPISGLDEVEVKRTGKNLFEVANDNKWLNGSGVIIDDSDSAVSQKISLAAGIMLTLSTAETGNALAMCFYDASGTLLQRTAQANVKSITTTSPLGTSYMYAGRYKKAGGENVLLEFGSTATAYEPYNGTEVTSSLPETVYGGTLDLETGELKLSKAKDTFNSTDTFVIYPDHCFSTNKLDTIVKSNVNNSTVPDIKSDIYTANTPNAVWNRSANAIITVATPNDSYKIRFYDSNLEGLSASDIASYMDGHSVVYELATPVTYQLTPEQIALFRGVNTISTNAKSIKVTYRNGKLALMDDIPQQLEIEEAKTDEKIDAKAIELLSLFAPIENGTTASQAYTTGEYFIHDGQFCKAKTSIASGATFTLNTNYEITTVGAEIYTALHS
jgi:hypothetical protein